MRRRSTWFRPYKSYRRRQTDKILRTLNNTASSTQTNIALYTATYPCTVSGIRWDLNVFGDPDAETRCIFVISVVPQGQTVSTISTTDNTSFYDPEQNVLGHFSTFVTDSNAGAGPVIENEKGQSMTKRRLKVGDTLVFSARGTSAETVTFFGTLQFFVSI